MTLYCTDLFLQISGHKRFYLFEPTEAGNLYSYPVSHPMDRRARVNLTRRHEADHTAAFPRLAHAQCHEVLVGPGDLLFLPAYWWHEVITEPVPEDGVCVSINFWFDMEPKSIPLPLKPAHRLEFSRQLEILTERVLGAVSVVPFLTALVLRLRGDSRWTLERPPKVDAGRWHQFASYVIYEATFMLGGPRQVLPFVLDLCDASRF
jgi:hypoxia-inducible factor 1-alpha inhibitor (HIF hydroxylase)